MTFTPPAFDDASLLHTLNASRGSGDDASQPEPVRFVRGVQRAIRSRRARMGGGPAPAKTDLAIFILTGSERRPAPADVQVDRGRQDLVDRIWFVGPPVSLASWQPIEVVSEGAIFTHIRDTLGLGASPCITFDQGEDTLRFYPQGVENADTFDEYPYDDGNVSLSEVVSLVDRIHHYRLVTPSAQAGGRSTWADRDRGFPHADAEAIIQDVLNTALWSAFPTCTVYREHTSTPGRHDLALVQRDPTAPSMHRHLLVVELKVFRACGSSGMRGKYSDQWNASWAKSGVEQAYAYALEFGAPEKAVFCFDMRPVADCSDCFDAIRDDADRLGVVLRGWPIFSSDSGYRAAAVGEQSLPQD